MKWKPQTDLFMFSYLLVRIITFLHTSLFQRIIIVKEKEKKMPKNSGLIEIRLQPEVDRQAAYALCCDLTQPRNVLEMQEKAKTSSKQ